MSEDGPDRNWSADEKSAYRRLVRAHHPDFGGDPETFAAEVARFHARRSAPQEEIITFVTKRKGLGRLVDAVSTHHRRRRRPPRVR
ncbi:hypothetical protein [Amycolatopsis sp. PS_44_ISF1]|uniref:hypothetical protein n=1 Tax=Amycolatopsis sp. PS_44_ISF1 TaxID=2974917 RepID=UPI0028DE1356|nr:hypothetical protein [Amycolatopsis sp. PS_44_ISF1]MDT8910019.1 hypothetical protein [Amycolatopsis sp. PS_44_ISF1]